MKGSIIRLNTMLLMIERKWIMHSLNEYGMVKGGRFSRTVNGLFFVIGNYIIDHTSTIILIGFIEELTRKK